LHNRRQIISSLSTISAAHKLVDQIAPKVKDRQGGYLRIKRSRLRLGDNAQMAIISFVDDVKVVEAPVVKKSPAKAEAKPKAEPKVKE
jgi:large subunit ribosomal protein L17